MTRPDLSRLRKLELAELAWRAREAGEIAVERCGVALRTPRWDRRRLARALTGSDQLDAVRTQLSRQAWQDAHVGLARYFEAQPARFVIAPALRSRVTAEITSRFPHAPTDASARGDRLVAGHYAMLGYRELPFDGSSWHTDVVHGRSAPLRFWSTVPYLDPQCGDHKITWEFNRHQHWLELGRAFWLTGDLRYRNECLRQLNTWLDVNPPLIGMNWASMLELSFRSLSWLWALNFFTGDAAGDENPWLVDLLLGLDRQLAHVERHLSYYFSPNTHLLGEALALYVAGRALPCLRASERRERVGRAVLLTEINRQITADGGHCERSAHYHRYTLDFYLLALAVARITNDPAASLFERAAARLAQAARLLADDNGILPHIGDDDGGSLLPITRRAPDDVRDSLAMAGALTGRGDLLVDDIPEELWWMLGHERFQDSIARLERAPRRTPWVSTALLSSGYYISRNDHGDHLVIDGGPHGYLNGGHAHADALALTFTRRGRPLLIDTGTGCYTTDADRRDRFRSSALHNTLTLNGRSQSLPRGPFHWQHTANATVRRWRSNRRFDYFVGTHDGYAPLAHYRHVLMLHDDLFIVADCVRTTGNEPVRGGNLPSQRAAVHWHIDPRWRVEIDGHAARFQTADGSLDGGESLTLHVAGAMCERFEADQETGLGWHAPEYGRVEPTTALRCTTAGELPLWIISVFSLDPSNHVTAVTFGTSDASVAQGHGTVVDIERVGSSDRLVISEPDDDRNVVTWRADDIESDARMLLARRVGGRVSALALVDACSARIDGDRDGDRTFTERLSDVFVEPAPAVEQRGDPWTSGSQRKAS
jgi:hypothetical protein